MKLEMTPRASVVCFTGHRMIGRDRVAWLRAETDTAVRNLIFRGFDTFVTGGALGFDTLSHQVVLRLREEFPYIRSVVAVPCRDQASRWPAADQALYRQLLHRSDEVILLSDAYRDGCMQARNRYMVDHAALCVAYYDGRSGGTGMTVRYAQQRGVAVMNLYR